jgi:hypothetical protein
MSTKAKISANGTYVFDPEEIEQLDELSLTSMIAAIDPSQPPKETQPADPQPVACAGDATINAILERHPEEPGPTYGEPSDEEAGDLIAPELIFTELPPQRR